MCNNNYHFALQLKTFSWPLIYKHQHNNIKKAHLINTDTWFVCFILIFCFGSFAATIQFNLNNSQTILTNAKIFKRQVHGRANLRQYEIWKQYKNVYVHTLVTSYVYLDVVPSMCDSGMKLTEELMCENCLKFGLK